MTTEQPLDGEPKDDSGPASAPFLPPPTSPPSITAPPVVERMPDPTDEFDVPFLPAVTRIEPDVQPPSPSFDAKAMVESQKRFNANPSYGAMPTGTAEGRAAAEALRNQARQKRHRQKTSGRITIAVLMCGLAVGAWFAYRAYQSDQDPQKIVDEPIPGTAPNAPIAPTGIVEPIRNDTTDR